MTLPTAWGVMNLVEAGEVALDSPLVQYLKSWKFPQMKDNYIFKLPLKGIDV